MVLSVRNSSIKQSSFLSAVIRLAVLMALLVFAQISFAQFSNDNQSPLMTPEELKTLDKARKKAYPGGRDEETLKVQAQLPVPSRKMSPATEAPADSGVAAPAASDD